MTEPDRVQALLEGLAALPPYDGVTFRGRSPEAGFGRQQRTTVTMGLTATSRDPRIATEGFSTSDIYAIVSQQGRDIAPFSARTHEMEVVFLPGTMFQVTDEFSVEPHLTVSLVVELVPASGRLDGPAVDQDRLKAAIADHLRAAYAGRPVQPGLAGKYVGDIT